MFYKVYRLATCTPLLFYKLQFKFNDTSWSVVNLRFSKEGSGFAKIPLRVGWRAKQKGSVETPLDLLLHTHGLLITSNIDLWLSDEPFFSHNTMLKLGFYSPYLHGNSMLATKHTITRSFDETSNQLTNYTMLWN